MGAAGSVGANAEANAELFLSGEEYIAVQIEGATGLQDEDWVGTSDPYCCVRYGKADASWEEKGSGLFMERKSKICDNTTSPEWRLAFALGTAEGEEMHIRIYDKDLVSSDDFLGEVKVTLATLKENQTDAICEHKITKKDGSGDQGTLKIRSGKASRKQPSFITILRQ